MGTPRGFKDWAADHPLRFLAAFALLVVFQHLTGFFG